MDSDQGYPQQTSQSFVHRGFSDDTSSAPLNNAASSSSTSGSALLASPPSAVSYNEKKLPPKKRWVSTSISSTTSRGPDCDNSGKSVPPKSGEGSDSNVIRDSNGCILGMGYFSNSSTHTRSNVMTAPSLHAPMLNELLIRNKKALQVRSLEEHRRVLAQNFYKAHHRSVASKLMELDMQTLQDSDSRGGSSCKEGHITTQLEHSASRGVMNESANLTINHAKDFPVLLPNLANQYDLQSTRDYAQKARDDLYDNYLKSLPRQDYEETVSKTGYDNVCPSPAVSVSSERCVLPGSSTDENHHNITLKRKASYDLQREGYNRLPTTIEMPRKRNKKRVKFDREILTIYRTLTPSVSANKRAGGDGSSDIPRAGDAKEHRCLPTLIDVYKEEGDKLSLLADVSLMDHNARAKRCDTSDVLVHHYRPCISQQDQEIVSNNGEEQNRGTHLQEEYCLSTSTMNVSDGEKGAKLAVLPGDISRASLYSTMPTETSKTSLYNNYLKSLPQQSIVSKTESTEQRMLLGDDDSSTNRDDAGDKSGEHTGLPISINVPRSKEMSHRTTDSIRIMDHYRNAKDALRYSFELATLQCGRARAVSAAASVSTAGSSADTAKKYN
mmetsp:Transcript_32173/g.69432  ORF Transcript_32173/g.69432 Transcript_32173/m.69432 type:complete len:612 (+) Transcript_32173:499-2334(+)